MFWWISVCCISVLWRGFRICCGCRCFGSFIRSVLLWVLWILFLVMLLLCCRIVICWFGVICLGSIMCILCKVGWILGSVWGFWFIIVCWMVFWIWRNWMFFRCSMLCIWGGCGSNFFCLLFLSFIFWVLLILLVGFFG